MKSILNKIARVSFIFIIPITFTMSSCQEDIEEPYQAAPPKDKLKNPRDKK